MGRPFEDRKKPSGMFVSTNLQGKFQERLLIGNGGAGDG